MMIMKPFIGNSRMKFKTRGFSYIEVLISIGILSFVMAFLVYLMRIMAAE